ncbi:hypothetical protein Vretimale_5240 [Volvox reticuliferus]|uniref:Uncharacterized protein n=1 Tax=Volvox reticuliferus TaxID=1737510 RepID=A0A8J4G5G5_9CHLO|nr:hypothetical protein Vretifemale_3688 [Volvox reticuliferus]GIM00421.1 hypothetical protein Vretimale_5240 [Volvox reticuliferus]
MSSLRAQITCSPHRPVPKLRQTVYTFQFHHRTCTHRFWMLRTCAQTGNGTAGDDTTASRNKPPSRINSPDPWGAPSSTSMETNSTLTVEFPSSATTRNLDPPSQALAVSADPPSPWDATSSSASHHPADQEPGVAIGAAEGSSSSSYEYGKEDPATAADGSIATVNSNRKVVESGAATAANSSSNPNGGSSSSSSNPFNMKEASASLSEDTAALLTRLRAELARTSNIPMPPRRPSGGSSNSSGASSGSSTSGNSLVNPTTSSSSSSNSSSSGSSSDNGAGRVQSGSNLAGTTPGTGSKWVAPPTAPTATSKSAAIKAAVASAPKPAGTVSTEALAAALEASGAAVPTDVTATTSSSSTTYTSSGSSSSSSSSTLAAGSMGRLIAGTASATATAGSGSSISASGNRAAVGTATAPVSSGSSSSGSSSGRRRKAVVVGGGIGGLVAAARLAKEGFSVTLLEANSQVGGRCQSVQRGRFRFDTGPSLLLFVETYRKAFAALGTSLAQQVPVVRVTPAAYRVFFQGAGYLDMLYDVQRMVEQLEGVEKGAGGQYLDWLAGARAALELGMEGFISRDAEGLGDLLGGAIKDPELRSLLSSVGVAELLQNHHERMSRRFRDPRLRALFTFQDLYVGLTPYNAPGVYSLLAATELTDGVWYPLGGFGQIRDALLRVGQGLGVRHRYGARVTAVRTAPGQGGGQVVEGITLASGEELDADLVVSNRDVPLTYELLRGPAEAHGSARARRLLAQDYSAGVISYNWSLNKKLDQLLHHNVFLSGDYEGSWVRATSADTLSRSPNFYVHCPSRTDPTACPPGSDSVMVLLPVANIQEVVKAQEAERRRSGPLGSLPGPLGQHAAGLAAAAAGGGGGGGGGLAGGGGTTPRPSATAAVDYSALVAAGREAVLRSLAEAGITDVRQHIVDELVIDPTEWRERYSLAHGAAFGLSHGLTQLSVLRPGLADKQVRGLYFVGASTRPGNGVPLAMISADLVVQKVMKDVKAGVV